MKDLYQEVTNQIIAALEAGTPPWQCPWSGHSALPTNLTTGKSYRGINLLMLAIASMQQQYADTRWLTFRQADEIGARVRKGEQGTPIIFFKMKDVTSDGGDSATNDETRRVIPMLRTYTVFNASQLDDLPERYELKSVPNWQPIAEAEELLYISGAAILQGGNRAFYVPSEDFIQLPPPAWFATPESYYATALHELAHWTGHASRLARELNTRKGMEAYAFEELIAEMGSAFLCAHCGLPPQIEHASYVDSWLNALKRDKRLIFVAAAAAQKAADYVLGSRAVVPSPMAAMCA